MYRMIGADGQTYGPVTAEQLHRWIAEGRANWNTLVQAEGTTEWKPLGQVPEFAPALKSTPPPLSPPAAAFYNPAIAARASNKVAAGLCGILLGGLGIHKFILGYNTAGLIMVLVAGLGSIPTCGGAYGVMHLIGLIEGIIYLTKTDEEFVRLYVDNQRQWF